MPNDWPACELAMARRHLALEASDVGLHHLTYRNGLSQDFVGYPATLTEEIVGEPVI